MAISIPPISGLPASSPTGKAGGPGQTRQAAGISPEDTEKSAGFTQAVGDALSDLGSMEAAVEDASVKAATGDLNSVGEYMIAATEAQLATEITVAVRDRAITAFNDIMRMQI